MKKIQQIINARGVSQLISANYAYWKLGTISINFLLLLTVISIQSAIAADNVVAENPQPQLSASQNLKASSIVSELNSQPNISLQQRLLASKESSNPTEIKTVSISHSLTANVEPETFNNSFSIDNFSLKSPEQLESNYKLAQQINIDLPLKEQVQEPTHILAQIDSSSPAGDTFSETDKLRQELLVDPITTVVDLPTATPGSTAGTPSAYGASQGQAYIGGGLYFPFDENKDRVDGSFSLGFGLGDEVESVGLEVNINITSAGGGGDGFDFGDSGGVGFKLHRYLGDGSAVAVGWSNPVKWGDVSGTKETIYGVFTKSFPLQPDNPENILPLTTSVGFGSGVFRSKGAIEADTNAMNLFASLGLRVTPQVSLVSSWTGNRLNMGASFVPFKKIPIVINTLFVDITDNLDTGAGFSLSGGYSFRF
ncbi:hypothetical protein [Nodularia sp. UHCC 0506]|uniref:hypothetical protein n=1 Tax=Nodularia sp. UHCC 0506 TaxID=3110243 RepID=UPI002B21C499|nr:hypothetical protein [Nodularia sp. UHCC 0506]MEA5516170.1 hypothetical protein [Nodularia sp. UHCC 0506]